MIILVDLLDFSEFSSCSQVSELPETVKELKDEGSSIHYCEESLRLIPIPQKLKHPIIPLRGNAGVDRSS